MRVVNIGGALKTQKYYYTVASMHLSHEDEKGAGGAKSYDFRQEADFISDTR